VSYAVQRKVELFSGLDHGSIIKLLIHEEASRQQPIQLWLNLD